MQPIRDTYSVIGELASLGNLLDWMLLETCLAASGDAFCTHAGDATGKLLQTAKRSVRDDRRLRPDEVALVRSVLAKGRTLMNGRGDAVHASYVVTPGVEDIVRVRIKRGASQPVIDHVTVESLRVLCGDLLEIILDLGAALNQVYPDRSARPGSTFAPVRASTA